MKINKILLGYVNYSSYFCIMSLEKELTSIELKTLVHIGEKGNFFNLLKVPNKEERTRIVVKLMELGLTDNAGKITTKGKEVVLINKVKE